MKKWILILLSIILTNAIFAQKKVISLNKAEKNSFVLKTSSKGVDILEVNTNLSNLSSDLKSTKSGDYITLESDGLVKTYDLGRPNIPIYSKLIELPLEASVKFKILSYDEEIIDLTSNGIIQKIIPAQPSISKSQEPDTFYYDKKTYSNNAYFNTKVTDFEEIGILRSVRLGRIIINPIQYNPVQNKLKILNNLKIEVEFIGSNHPKTQELKSKYSSNLFNNVVNDYIQNSTLETKQLTTETITYVIVSDRMFESALAPFIAHKQSLGYNVIVGYTDNSNVGNTTTSIKAYLKGLYDTPPSGYSPPHYVLLVGDIAQVPSYTSGDHVTDLYYFDYTNDNIPDVFYGRFSATSTAQLTPQIEKTLEYANYSMPDPTYLHNAILIAGNDPSHELTWGNGQVNYGANEYFNSNNGITAYTYLQNEPSGGNYSTNIIANIDNGVGFANYSAHCSPSGWADPSFSTSNITSLTNAHKYGLWVGNCCRSNRFSESECFGEAALRAPNKGAVGYIGATDYTYWDEDYWWAVGFKTVSANPSYNASHLGAFDRLFHTHGESTSNWYSTQGQLLIGGNLAVQESTSYSKLYYWEIYHLMGDPSLEITNNISCKTTNVSGVISSDNTYPDCKIEVINTTIQNNANVILDAKESTTINGPFEVQIGSTLEIK